MSPSYSPADWIREHLNPTATNGSCVFVLFDTTGELLSGKLCLLTHLSASTPAEGCELSALVAWLSKAQFQSHVYYLRAWIYEQCLLLSAVKL